MTVIKNKHRNVKAIILLIVFGTILFAFPAADSASVLQTGELLLGDEVKASGQKLMTQSAGFTRIHDDSAYELRTVVIGVHGTKSRVMSGWNQSKSWLENTGIHTSTAMTGTSVRTVRQNVSRKT